VRGTLAESSLLSGANDVILLDGWLRNANVYENCASCGQDARAHFVVVEYDNNMAESIARFCGATGVLRRPLVPSKMREASSTPGAAGRAAERRARPRPDHADAAEKC
jgi:hypothetical protein